jgi:serine phosphatase RsbU (regulator of sigma subunit)
MEETVHDRLTAQIALLHDWVGAITRVQTLNELASQFADIARQVVPCSEISALLRGKGAERWEYLVGHRRDGVEDLVGGNAQLMTAPSRLAEIPDGVMAARRLSDGAELRLIVQWPASFEQNGASHDSAAVELLAFVFESAYREYLVRRRTKELVFSLNHRVLQLNSLIDTGIEVTRLGQDESPTRLALERAAALTNASAGRVRVLHGETLLEDIVFPSGLDLEQDARYESRIETDIEFDGKTYLFELFNKESREGGVQFEPTDHLLLDALARQVQASLESRHLHKQALEKQRLEQDLRVAASIQERILPTDLPSIAGYDLAGINIPSKSVGGDYYDCIPLVDGRYALVMADVAGKGIPAALLVSSLHAYLHAYLESGVTLVDLVRRLNQVIYTASTDDKFITAFVAILDPATGAMESVNAGHNPVYCARMDGTIDELNTGGVALGMLDMDFPYQSETTTLAKGEGLLLYTDGVTEAADEAMRLYESQAPLKEFLAGHRQEAAQRVVELLIADIQAFTGAAPQIDDITALYIRREGQVTP